jgi:protein phosphatase 1L
VGGVLAMSRAFGNRLLKPYVVAEPEIQVRLIDYAKISNIFCR